MRRGPGVQSFELSLRRSQDHPAPDPDVVEHLQDPLHFGTRELEMPAGFRLLEATADTQDFAYRSPMKFGGRVVTAVTLLDVTVEVETRADNGFRLTRAEIEQYAAQHPTDRAALYNPYTVIKRQGDRLIAVPYHAEYKQFLDPMAKDLRDAASLSDDPAFANFLRLRASALLSDDYYGSDLVWLDLKDPKFDVIFAPY